MDVACLAASHMSVPPLQEPLLLAWWAQAYSAADAAESWLFWTFRRAG
jgi:hypothetical protein